MIMYTTKEYLATDPWEAVINCVNAKYLTDLSAYTTELKTFESLGGTLTKIHVDPHRSIDPNNTQPEVTVEEYVYDRLDLGSFFVGPALKELSGFELPTSTFKVLDAIGELNGIKFTLNDFMHFQYDTYQKVYSLKANPKSLRFVGQVDFQFVNTTKQLLSNLGNQLELPKANAAPLGTVKGKLIGQYATSGFDFSSIRELIKDLKASSTWPSGKRLAAAISAVTTYPWTCTATAGDWNIAGEVRNGEALPTVIYNGIVLPRYSPRTDIQRVCVIRLGDLASNVSGYLLLHYN